MKYPIPEEIRLNPERNALSLVYGGETKTLSAEFLRVYSPSAEVRGHGKGQETLQTGKAQVSITDLSAAGNYALKITFSDGHDSGLYDWDYLYKSAHEYATMWADYLARLEAAGASRMPSENAQNEPPAKSCGGCGKH
ncbi:MAG: DUF971 domain-containing protein [Neisseria sp.]|nr:DUF971 domain-containing protein [Neisseria sp.]